MLSINGMLNGITALLVVVFATLFGIIYLIKSIRLKANILKYGALMGMFAGWLWLGPTVDFLYQLINGINMDNSQQAYGILSYMWVGPTLICAMFVGTSTIIPEKKMRRRIILIFYTVTASIFEVVLFIDRASTFTFTVEPNDLIDAQFVYLSPAFLMIAFFLISVLLFCGIGSIHKARQSTGVIKKNFLLLALAFNLFVIVAVFDAFIQSGGILYIVRLGMIICAFSMYYALKT